MRITTFLAATLLLVPGCAPRSTVAPSTGDAAGRVADVGSATWPGWGGPGGDFKVPGAALAEAWPVGGPPELWSRPLGPGYASIAADGGTLYTMYRDEDQDVVVALHAENGAERWSHRYEARTREGNVLQFGSGPNATPLVLDDRVVTLGYTGVLNSLDRETGRPVWTRELIGAFAGEVLSFGYSASPVLHDGKLIVLVGGERQAVLALDPADGEVVWRSPPGSVSYATPIVADVDGQDQLIYFAADEIVGLDASNGERLWSHPCVNQYNNNATGPLWGDDNLLWVATQLDGGTRVLRLTRQAGATRVEEVWSSAKISIHFWNALRLGDRVYASIGGQASILAAIDVRTGEILWRERGFEQINFVQAGDTTILLDGNGHLALVDVGPAGLTVRSQARITEDVTWTPPTLLGTTLFVRDKRQIRAFDLGS